MKKSIGKADKHLEERAKELFDTWQGRPIWCPDLRGKDSLILNGDRGFLKSKNIEFNIRMCSKAKNPNCKEDNDIKEYVKDVLLDSWALFEKIDYSILDNRPTFLV